MNTNTQVIDETKWQSLTDDEFDDIDSQVRFTINNGAGVASLAEYVEQFCTLANKAALAKNPETRPFV
jgi:hypothetical protein